MPSRSSTVAFYTHAGQALGHIGRAFTLGAHLRTRWPDLTEIFLSGCPLSLTAGLPEGARYVPLPALHVVREETGLERWVSTDLDLPLESVLADRREILLAAAAAAHPAVFIVDFMPAGLLGELLPTLHLLRQSAESRLILLLRDVLDEPARVRAGWQRGGVYEVLDDLYDEILMYGQQEIYDPLDEYGFGRRATEKTRFVGYPQPRPPTRQAAQVRAELGLHTDRLVVVTAGGGADGGNLYRTVLEGLARHRPSEWFDCLLVGGPFLPAVERQQLRSAADALPDVHWLDSTDDLISYIAAADLVVSMAGFNTLTEVVYFERPAVVVPRTRGISEQLIRARLFAERGLVSVIEPAELTSERVLDEILRLLKSPSPVRQRLDFCALPRTDALLEPAFGPPAE